MAKTLTDAQRTTTAELMAEGKQMEAAQYVQSVLNCDLDTAIAHADDCGTVKMIRDSLARAVNAPAISPKTPAEKP